MANEIKLEVYTFGIRQRNSTIDPTNYKTLGTFSDKEDFLDCFKEYLASLDSLELHDNLKKALKINTNSIKQSKTDRTISGIFESGGYGIESEIYNTATNKKKYTKQIDDTEILPFYFLIGIPKDRNIGILIIQRIGIFGISTVLKESLSSFFKSKYEDFVIDFNPLISKELAKAFIKDGGVKEIILRKYNLPEDKADRLGLKKYASNIRSIELRIKAKGIFSGFNDTINKYLSDPNATFFDIRDLRNIGFENGVKYSVVSDYNGSTRTIDLTDSMQIRPYYDIDEEVKKEKGHPVFSSINPIAKGLLEELQNEINLKK